MMSRTSLILTIVLTLAGAWISDAQVDFTYQITGPRINPAGEYQLLLLDNTMPDGRVGEPVLPYHSISLILPPGHIADRMEIITGQFVELPGTYRLAPAQASRPLSSTGTPHWEIHTGVYSQDGPYPSQPEGKIITQFLNGYSIALSTFTPAVYYPSSGKLGYYQTITVRIFTRLAQDAVSALSNLKDSRQIRDRLGRLAQNPEAVASYPAQDPGSDDYELLIITPNQFSSGFQSLADLYLRRGMRTAITTVEEIQTGGTGQDLQEKIRNHIIQEYQDHGIGFVLLGGDVEYVPYRGFYCKVISSSVYEDDDIPADLYYGALDGTWNDDGDNLWGEPGEDDLLPELGVGRFPVSNTTELNNVVHKSESYQDTPVTGELRDPLLAGEHLWSDPPTWGSDYLELLIGYHDDNGYTTTGIPEDHNIDKLYEEIQPWGASDLIAKINQGKSFLHHSGHANETYVAFLSNSDITNSNFNLANGTDHNYTLMFSHGCYCGSFDYNDCIMERMVNIENFAVSVIGNSRYGWFNEGQTEGPAAHMHREYADALYHEKIGCLGDAFAEMKIQTAPWVTAPGQWEEGALRWNFYDINILGNPALAVWADEPITIQVNYQAAIPIGVPSTQVTVTSNGSPVEGLTCALLKDGTLHGAALTGSNGTAVIQLDPAFTQVGDAELVVSGYNCLPTQYPVTVIPNAGAYVIYSSHQIDDSQGNGNGQVDFGETIGLTVEIENVGSQQASNVAVQLSTSDAYITITDGFESYGNIPAGSSLSVTNGFSFDVATNIPDGHNVTFQLEITGSGTWNSGFSILVNAPELSIGTVNVDDSQGGNGNGILDPGETADLLVACSNTGHSACNGADALLSSLSTEITINTGSIALGTLNPDETKTALFNVTVSGAVQPGTSVDLTVVLESGEYSAEKTFYLTIGLILEDFETGDFSSFPWQFGGNGNWIITATGAYEGAYCSKSGSIGNSETSELMVTMEVLSADSISFFRKVSSEEDYDYLEFYIDGVLMGEWSGEEGWSKVSFPVGPGNRTFKWVYSKDWYVTGGSDCAWIDYIVFPPVTGSGGTLSVNATATPAVICQGESSQLNAYASGGNGNYSFQWTPPTGLNNPNIPNPIATPTATITYTVTVSDGADVVTDQVTVTVHPVPETPIIQQIDDYLYSNAVDGNHWYNSNGPVQGATGQIFYPTATDYYYVIVTNTYGCESNPSNSIYFVFTGMEELDSRWIRVYPNPASDFWYVEMQIEEAGEVEVSLSGLSGKTIPGYGDTRILETGLHRMVFPADGLKPGIYLLQIRMNGSIRTIKLVIY